ncbi:hypothetical protein [Oceanihabitans sediminis]|uniref:hypothetical protein n=1 Tax=Oceanihabitans sediminis TaxID=1812012 RepID=UPI00299E8601|nr:hypothetical protein [Oceanihabitans sediminis]
MCIPYSNSFIEAVKDVAIAINPELIMIHSTLPVMTTRILQDNLDFKIVHTPVMGKHPNLTDSIETFDKIVASYSDEANELACQHLADLGVETVIYNNPEESEMAKLLDTTYYGWNILYMKEVKKLCDEYNLDFDNVYTQTNEIYNSGYECMGDFNVIRPVLQFVPGKIGGHCVRPNFELLKDIFKPAKIGIEMDDENDSV